MIRFMLFVLILCAASCTVKNGGLTESGTGKEPAEAVSTADTSCKDGDVGAPKKKHRIIRQDPEELKQELHDVVKQTRPLMKTLMKTISNDDYETFLGICSPAMRSMYHEEKIFLDLNKRRRDKYGMPGAHPVKDARKMNPYYILTYLVKFSKVAQPVPVVVYLKKHEEDLKIHLVQYGFSKVVK